MHRFAWIAAIALGAVMAAPISAQTPAPTVPPRERFVIGGVVSLSGPYSSFGQSMQRGVELAVAMRGGRVLGAPIELRWEDSATSPQVAVQKATSLIAGGIDTLFGAVGSAETLAVMRLTEQRRIPQLITASASDSITGDRRTRYAFRTSDPIAAYNRMAVEFVRARNFRRIYGVANDNAVNRDALEAGLTAMRALGAEVVGRDFPALEAVDYSVIINNVTRANADALFMYIGSGPGIAFLKQAAQVNLAGRTTIFGPVLIDDQVLQAVGNAALGVYSGARYSFTQDNDANRRFVAAYRERYNEWPDENAGEAFDGMSWWLDVVESTGSWDRERWVDAFRGSVRENSIQGRKAMRACDNQAEQVGIWGRVTEGQSPMPPIMLRVESVFPADALYDRCQ
jgi:branched-chain amino acid transport system substrate-binding protein